MAIAILGVAGSVRADEDSSSDIDWLRHVHRMPPRQDHDHIRREQSLAFINVNTRIHQEPLIGNMRPPADFSWWAPRPSSIPVGYVQADPLFDDPLQPMVNPIRNAEEWMWLYAGTNFDLYDSMVMQALSDSLPGTRSSEATNRFNIRMDTKLLEWEDRSHTQFTVQWRANNFMPSNAQPLAESVDSPTGLNAQRTIYDTKLNRLILAQGFLEDRLTVSLGKINPNDYMGLNLFASDETSQFLNTALDGNNVLPVGFQGYTEGAAFQFLPVDWFYLNGVASSASGTAGYYFDKAFQRGVFTGLETGLILRDPNGGARADLFPTAASLLTAVPGAVAGTSFIVTIRNTADAAETITMTTNTGLTLSGTMTIAQNAQKSFLVTFTDVSTAAVTIYSMGSVTF